MNIIMERNRVNDQNGAPFSSDESVDELFETLALMGEDKTSNVIDTKDVTKKHFQEYVERLRGSNTRVLDYFLPKEYSGEYLFQINWDALFVDKLGVKNFSEPVVWEMCVDNQGNFDVFAFNLSRISFFKYRANFLRNIINLDDLLKQQEKACGESNIENMENNFDFIMYVLNKLKDCIGSLKQFVGDVSYGYDNNGHNNELKQWCKEKEEYIIGLRQSIRKNYDGSYQKICPSIFIGYLHNIRQDIHKLKESEMKLWHKYYTMRKKDWEKHFQEYLDEDGFLDTNSVVQYLRSGMQIWGEKIFAHLFLGKIRRKDLKEFQRNVVCILNDKLQKCNIFDVASIMQWIFPYIFSSMVEMEDALHELNSMFFHSPKELLEYLKNTLNEELENLRYTESVLRALQDNPGLFVFGQKLPSSGIPPIQVVGKNSHHGE